MDKDGELHMKTDGTKMTFRFPDRKVVEPNNEDQIHTDKIELQSSVTWSEWNSIEVDKPDEEEGSNPFAKNELKHTSHTPSETEAFDKVNGDLYLLQDQSRIEYGATEKVEHQSTPPDRQGLPTEHRVLLETDSIQEQEEWTWAHSSPYQEVGPAHTRKRPPSVMKLIGSVIGALATGLLFTFLALSLIRGEVAMPDRTEPIAAVASLGEGSNGTVPAQQQTDASDDTDASSKDDGGNVNNQVSIAVDIPAAQAYVLQYGVYAKDEGAQQAISELQSLGLGGVLAHDAEGNRRVYAAVSMERDDAMLLSASLQTKEGSIYVRPFQREAITKLTFTGDKDVLNSFMSQSDVVREWLIQQSSKMLQQSVPEAFSLADMDVLRTEHLRWTQWGQQIQKNLGEHAADQWLKMVQAMNTAISGVNEYNKKPASAHLWNIQQACMQYMLLEQEWLTGMKE